MVRETIADIRGQRRLEDFAVGHGRGYYSTLPPYLEVSATAQYPNGRLVVFCGRRRALRHSVTVWSSVGSPCRPREGSPTPQGN